MFLAIPLLISYSSLGRDKKNIDIPSSFDREKVSSGFKFSLEQTSFTGSKRNYNLELIPTGDLTLNSVYFGNTDFSCSNQGGTLSLKLPAKEHADYVIDALHVTQEVEGDQAALDRAGYRGDNPPANLNVEYDNNYYSSILNLASPKAVTKQFLAKMQNIGVGMLKDKNATVLALSMFEKRDFKSQFIDAKLVNSGNKQLQVKLPPSAQQHFMLRLGDGGVMPLTYRSVPAQLKQILKPGQSITVSLTIPKEIAPSSGLLIYDNTPEIVGADDQKPFVNSIAVSLCPILPNNSRAEYK